MALREWQPVACPPAFTVTATAGCTSGTHPHSALTVGTPPPAPWIHGDLGDVLLDGRACGTLGLDGRAYGRAYGTLGRVAALRTGSTTCAHGTLVVRATGTDPTVDNRYEQPASGALRYAEQPSPQAPAPEYIRAM
ncbi:hypothetical protein ACIP4Y_09700 [Streptomyces sp. NPDC088810]|uniref:hypothetical protein n=1 Tax=Streptomyces sp. NPDC088810 TaxID=3365904 RepID=UPI0037FB9092